jgi:hypothetical protein
VDDARYQAFQRASENGATYAAFSALAGGPLLACGAAVLLFATFRRARFAQVLAITAHAGVILAVRQAIAAPLTFSRETLASPATLGLLFPMLDEASPLARFLGVLDLFVIWWVVALALGTAVLYGRRARPLVAGFVGAYIAIALVLALVMALTGGAA